MNAHNPRRSLNTPSPELIRQFADIVGPEHVLTDADRQVSYLHEPRNTYVGKTVAVVRPGTTEEVSRILALANEAEAGVVPQGGNTGLVGGQIPFESGAEIVLSLARLNRLRSIDAGGMHMIVEAGMTLANAQQAADDAGLLFPLSLGAEGTCQIGGNLATNAGGVAVLAYGTARQLVLGLEVVLADGRIWNGLRTLKKDNTGYDLRDLFIGAEGTLGVITAASLKLFPRPAETVTALVSLSRLDDAIGFFRLLQAEAGMQLTAFEFISARAMEFVAKHISGTRFPLSAPAPWYVLFEISSLRADGRAEVMVQDVVEAAISSGVASDAVVAASLTQANDLWRLRETIPEAQNPEGGSIKHDVSVPIEKVPEFISRAAELVEGVCPGARPVPFGHIGDGNVHYNVSQPIGMAKAEFLALRDKMTPVVHGLVRELGGSFSAEHGIGRMKRAELAATKSEVEIDMMRRIKAALDPKGIMNPGKVL